MVSASLGGAAGAAPMTVGGLGLLLSSGLESSGRGEPRGEPNVGDHGREVGDARDERCSRLAAAVPSSHPPRRRR